MCCTTPDYAVEMIDYLKVTAAETPFLLRNPDEVTYTVESEKEILNNMLENAGSVMMMALVDGETAGNASISAVGTRRRVRHRCSLAIALKKKFWGLGIGTAMMEYLIELPGKWAMSRWSVRSLTETTAQKRFMRSQALLRWAETRMR